VQNINFLCSRRRRDVGHEVRLMPAQYVKAYIKRNKHDAAEAEAFARRFSARRCDLCRSRRQSPVADGHPIGSISATERPPQPFPWI